MKKTIALFLATLLLLTLLPTAALASTYSSVSGKWEIVKLDWGNSTLTLGALVLDKPLVNCTQLTVNMDVSMKYNTSCYNWSLLGREKGEFRVIGSLSLPGGNGHSTQTLTFDKPINADAFAIRPEKTGSYSWEMDFRVTNVFCDDGKDVSEENQTEGQFQVGDIVSFGSYEQDNDPKNGAEPIEWLVIRTEEDGRKLVLLSLRILDCVPFATENKATKWQDSNARTWLNDTFLKKAFSEEERQYLETMELENKDNPAYGTKGGNVTRDLVGLLSIEEAENIFLDDNARCCEATAYAKAQGVQSYSSGAWWRLRSPGKFDNSVASVRANGAVDRVGDTVIAKSCGLRPVVTFKFPE